MNILDLPFFAYNIKNTKWRELMSHLQVSVGYTGRSQPGTLLACLIDSLRYEISPTEYFLFGFPFKEEAEKREWAGTTFMYKAQRRLNPNDIRHHFQNKALFRETFSKYIHPEAFVLTSIDQHTALTAWLRSLKSTRIIVKPLDGQCGVGVSCHSFQFDESDCLLLDDKNTVVQFLEKTQPPALLEPRLQNHPLIERIAPNALNTLRVMTFVDSHGSVEIVGATMRFSRKGVVDNLASGGIAAPVDVGKGILVGPAVGSQPDDCVRFDKHPVTEQPISGVALPYCHESIELAKSAAQVVPEARSIGWDIAITPAGPYLLEGNHNWCKLLWQLPVSRGLRPKMQELLSRLENRS